MNSLLSAGRVGGGSDLRKVAWSLVLALLLPLAAGAQFSSGSTGADGELNPTENITIDMADHPDGIYHYTSVTIPGNVHVRFSPNTKNTPVVWLVQGKCTIQGNASVGVYGINPSSTKFGATGGPGGFAGGNGSLAGGVRASAGHGPGGGQLTSDEGWVGGNASHRTAGEVWIGDGYYGQYPAGIEYGNSFLLPLVGGSGGGGGENATPSGGGVEAALCSSQQAKRL